MASKTKKVASIVDVAKRAGVSVATVSRVLNDSAQVKSDTKENIRKVAAQMGYALPICRPGPKPGRPQRKKTVTLLFFLDHQHYGASTPSTFLMLQKGVLQGARDLDLRVQTHMVSAESEFPEQISDGGYRGFLLIGSRPHSSCEEFLKSRPCCWLMNNPWTPTWGDHVMPDHREVGMMAAEHLLNRSVQRPAVIKLGAFDRVQALRQEGFLYSMAQKQVKSHVVTAKGRLPDSTSDFPEIVFVEEIVENLKKITPCPDGYFFDSDHSLAMLYPVMVREKLIDPARTPLIGCNNEQQYLRDIRPHPATVEVHFDMIGRHGIAQLAWRMKNQEFSQRVRSYISPSLIQGYR
jgi:DNA-binding LacI/PurR family transcriptional regulator